MSYKKVYEKLLALPEDKKRFASARYFDSVGDYCVLGACAPALSDVPAGMQDRPIDRIVLYYPKVLEEILQLGMTLREAGALQNRNDTVVSYSDVKTKRYNTVMSWLEHRVKEEEDET